MKRPSSKAMEILHLVKLSEIDPIYFETSFIAVPEGAGKRAYALLLRTMEEMKYAAISRITLHPTRTAAIIRPYHDG
jgi:DNA end-binding protein Ku